MRDSILKLVQTSFHIRRHKTKLRQVANYVALRAIEWYNLIEVIEMFEISHSKEQIIIKRNTTFLGVGVVTIIMAIAGVRLLFGLLPFEEDYTFADVFGLIFVCVWIGIVISMGVFAFVTNSKQITINNYGILCKSWINKKFIKWDDIKDWGLSYCGQTRGEGNTYYLYFSKHECQIKNDCKKKLKGKMIKAFVIGNDYSEAINKIIPFCSEKTNIIPFLGKDIYHFI
ncbi:MAG: hypothetical protein J6C29_04260 [Clostridia bacterium]|nr:hypothetical protein [Clostridia bacterium]